MQQHRAEIDSKVKMKQEELRQQADKERLEKEKEMLARFAKEKEVRASMRVFSLALRRTRPWRFTILFDRCRTASFRS